MNPDSHPPERRATTRHSVDQGSWTRIRSSRAVRIVDLSGGGALLASPRPYALGIRGRLSFKLAGQHLAPVVEIRRVSESFDHRTFSIGVSFVELADDERDAVERLVRTRSDAVGPVYPDAHVPVSADPSPANLTNGIISPRPEPSDA